MALADNKVKIQALLAGINALPEAGSGEAPAPVLQEKSVTPAKEAQSITPDTGYDGLSKVNVDAIPDQYIVPSGTVDITENGEHDVREAETVNVNVPTPEPVLQEKTVTPSETAQTVTPDSGYDGLSAVSVGAISTTYIGSSVPKQAAQTITPGTDDKTIASGQYLTGTQTIKGDANLVAGNIKSGVSIFGVAGSYEGSDGDSSGGGDGETCTVGVDTGTNNIGIENIVYRNSEAWVNDGVGGPIAKNLTVLKGTNIFASAWSIGIDEVIATTTGSVAKVFDDGYVFVFEVNGNGTIGFKIDLE